MVVGDLAPNLHAVRRHPYPPDGEGGGKLPSLEHRPFSDPLQTPSIQAVSERETGIEPATFSLGKCPGTVTERADALLSEATPLLEHTGTSLPLRLGSTHGGMHSDDSTPS
jgi:hypothetical protein